MRQLKLWIRILTNKSKTTKNTSWTYRKKTKPKSSIIGNWKSQTTKIWPNSNWISRSTATSQLAQMTKSLSLITGEHFCRLNCFPAFWWIWALWAPKPRFWEKRLTFRLGWLQWPCKSSSITKDKCWLPDRLSSKTRHMGWACCPQLNHPRF